MKFNFRHISHKDIIVLDDGYSNINFKDQSYELINYNSINIFCAFKTIIKYIFEKNSLSLRETYKQNLYRMYSPKLAISHHINKSGVECKYLCPEIKIVIYQFTYSRNLKFQDVLGRFKKKKIKSPVDYFFVYHQNDKISLDFKKSNIFIIGSLKNNEVKSKILREEKNTLLYISEFNPRYPYSKNYYKIEKKFIKILYEFCKLNNKKFNIALRSNRKDKKINKKEELEYYGKMIGNNFNISPLDSYDFASKSEVKVCISSNLGIELLSRGQKILFVLLKEQEGGVYPYLPRNEEIFIQRKIDKKKIFYKLKKIYSLKKKTWLNSIKLKKNKIKFDPGNQLFKRKIKKIIENSK